MTKPTVVLLHGVGLDHTMWDPVGRAAGWRCRRGDARTCPATVRRPPLHRARRHAWPTWPTDVAAGIPPGSHLVGFSLGALVAQHLARYRPELVATLTSVSSVCRRTAEERAAVLDRLRTAETRFRRERRGVAAPVV